MALFGKGDAADQIVKKKTEEALKAGPTVAVTAAPAPPGAATPTTVVITPPTQTTSPELKPNETKDTIAVNVQTTHATPEEDGTVPSPPRRRHNDEADEDTDVIFPRTPPVEDRPPPAPLVTVVHGEGPVGVDSNFTAQMTEIGIDRVRWANRRLMAWAGIIFMIAFAYCLLVGVLWNDSMAERLAKNKDLLSWPLILMIGIPLAYMGATVIDKRSSSQESNIDIKSNTSSTFSNTPSGPSRRRRDDDDDDAPRDPPSKRSQRIASEGGAGGPPRKAE